MAEIDTRTTEAAPHEHVTIIREGRGSGGVIVALIALVLIGAAAFWAISSGRGDNSDGTIDAAAEKVGAAADKVGAAADTAAERTTR